MHCSTISIFQRHKTVKIVQAIWIEIYFNIMVCKSEIILVHTIEGPINCTLAPEQSMCNYENVTRTVHNMNSYRQSKQPASSGNTDCNFTKTCKAYDIDIIAKIKFE